MTVTLYMFLWLAVKKFPRKYPEIFSWSQHCFRQWLGTVRQEAMTWSKVDPNVWSHMISPGRSELMLSRMTSSTCLKYFQWIEYSDERFNKLWWYCLFVLSAREGGALSVAHCLPIVYGCNLRWGSAGNLCLGWVGGWLFSRRNILMA